MSMFVAGDLNLLLLKGKLFPLFLPGGSFAGPLAPAGLSLGIPPAKRPPSPPLIEELSPDDPTVFLPPLEFDGFGFPTTGALLSLVTVFFNFFALKLLMSDYIASLL